MLFDLVAGLFNNYFLKKLRISFDRYDGIYKIVKYWPEKGKSGFLVWRYFLQRDDPIPPVWTEEGKKRIQQLGLDQVIVRAKMIYMLTSYLTMR